MRKYIFGIEIDPVEEGKVYEHMPLHCTLAHWFFSDFGPQEIMEKVSSRLSGHGFVELISEESALYGPNKDISVNVLVRGDALINLHRKVLEGLDSLNVEYAIPEYMGKGYKPHVTRYDGRSFSIGNKHEVKRIYLVEALDENSPPKKKVQALFTLT